MSVTRHGCRAGLALLVLSAAASAQLTKPPAPPSFPHVNDAVTRPCQPTFVPPTLEIQILDPNVDPRGNPTAVTRPGPDGRIMVDIPPTVLVHRYYYTGDRNFQLGLLAGGPCIVVVNHPRTGERLYVPVQMLPGAPRVYYTANSIEYDYGTQGITISFPLLCCEPKVYYRNGRTVTAKIENVTACAMDATRRLINRTKIPECADKAASGVRNVTLTTIDRTNDAVDFLLGPPKAIIMATPLGTFFMSPPEERARQERDSLIQRADVRADRLNVPTIPTNR